MELNIYLEVKGHECSVSKGDEANSISLKEYSLQDQLIYFSRRWGWPRRILEHLKSDHKICLGL